MSSFMKILFWLLIWSRQESATGISVKKFVYTQDMSEHCRRRVMPSVFLGRHVVDANSQILHFSRIDLPYSCYISVRAESASNIILVFQLVSDVGHVNPCKENSDQLLVYEMGETFGGYWGALPEFFIRPPRRPSTTSLYTLKTSAFTWPSTTTTETTPVSVETITPLPSESDDIAEEQDFIELNIPVANISAVVVPGAYKQENVFKLDDLYDFMPSENVSYQTSILPLVQVSLKDQNTEGLSDARKMMAPYQFDYNLPFTPDIRLTYPRVRGKTPRRIQFPKYTSYVNRLRTPLRRKHPMLSTHDKNSHYITRYKLALERHKTTDSIKNKFIITNPDSGEQTATAPKSVDELMREFNKSIIYNEASENKKDAINITALLIEMSNVGYNASAYLYPEFQINNLFRSNLNTPGTISKRNHSFIESSLPFTSQSESNINTIFKMSNTEQWIPQVNEDIIINSTEISGSQVSEAQKYINKSDTTQIVNDQNTVTEKTNFRTANGNYIMKPGTASKVSSTPQSGSLVDHESWENVVQVAPVMASLLNQSAEVANASRLIVSNSQESVRKKRNLQPIPIDNAKPYSMTTKETVPTTVSTTFHVSDIQDFFRIIELRDDELHERIALRYLRQYLGPSVFNICEFTEPKARHVHLFNSSRIVIALTNFTIEKMTVVITPARTLLNGEGRCATTNLECQVTGTRVCINSMSACDGVPNCGAYDIFDEDRLMCGAAVGLQHNVWLAAVAFLAVMLTVLYAVHYWLSRCVPKVSKAFFVYSDGDENTLYLDSIMRSPNDMLDRPIYDNLLEDEILYSVENKARTKTCCSWVAKFFNKFKKSTKEENLQDYGAYQHSPDKRTYSFAETEIRKIARKDFTDVSVQTGENLEMSDLRAKSLKLSDMKVNERTDIRKQSITSDHLIRKWDITSIESEDRSYLDELSLIKLFKDSKDFITTESKEAFLNLTLESNTNDRLRNSEEREIQSHVYDRTRRQSVFPTTSSVNIGAMETEKPSDITAQIQQKRLRFFEEPVAFQSIATINQDKSKEKHKNIQELHKIDDFRQVPSTSRDFKRFFSGSKGKKSKNKKSLKQLR